MTDKNLNEEQLNNISGGEYSSKFNIDYNPNAVDQYDTRYHIGEEVLILSNGNFYIACGTLLESFEESWGCGTRRAVRIKLNPNYTHYHENQDVFQVDTHSCYKVYLVNKYYQ